MNRSPGEVIDAMAFAALDKNGSVSVLLGDNEIARLVLAWREQAERTNELREAAYDYAHLIQVENFPKDDMAVHRAYERLRKALGEPNGLRDGPRLVVNK